MTLIRAVAMFVVTATLGGAQTTVWGTPQNGIRIGLAAGAATAEPTIRVIFENVGPAEQTLLIGRSIGTGPIYNLEFSATSPIGEKRQIFIGGPGAVGGYMSPLAVRLAHGETSEVTLSMRRMVAVLGPGAGVDRPLDALLQEGYSVQASLELGEQEVAWSVGVERGYRFQKMWTGKMLSGEYRQPR